MSLFHTGALIAVIIIAIGAWFVIRGVPAPDVSNDKTATSTSGLVLPDASDFAIQTTSNGEVYVTPQGMGLLAVPEGWTQTVQSSDEGGETVVFASDPTNDSKPPLIIVSWEPKSDAKNAEARAKALRAQKTVKITGEQPSTIVGAKGYTFDGSLTRNGLKLEETIYMVEKGDTYYEIVAVTDAGNASQKRELKAILKTLKLSR